MEILKQALYRHVDELCCSQRIWIAYSGGVDSHALLSACHKFLSHTVKQSLCAVHIHHGLMPDAEQWSDHCRKTAERLGVEFKLIRVDVADLKGLGPERAAREARYQALKQLVQAGDHLLTAHHQEDQAETVLLQLFRGAGVDGLSAMPELTSFGEGRHLRPFLGISRTCIVNYAKTANLKWIEDQSNQDQSLDRNYVRHTLTPLVNARWPAYARNASRSAKLMGETSEWLRGHAEARLVDQPKRLLALAVLKDEPGFVRRLLMRTWLRRAGVLMPSYQVLDQLLIQLVDAREDAQPRCILHDVELRRYRDHIYLLPARQVQANSFAVPWPSGQVKCKTEFGTLKVTPQKDGGICQQLWQLGRVEVRSRWGGERLKQANRKHHTSLKHWYQEHHVPPWIRECAPLVYLDGVLVAIADLWVSPSYVSAAGEPGFSIEWQSPYGPVAENQT